MCVPFLHTVVGIGQAIDAAAEAAEARLVGLDFFIVEAGGAIEADTLLWRLDARIGDEVAAHEIVGAAHPQFDAETAHQPAGQPDMIGMEMGDDDPLDRLAAHGPGEQSLLTHRP